MIRQIPLNRLALGAAVLLMAASLAACGGDDYSNAPGAGAIPSSAGTSTSGLMNFMQGMSPSDNAEPLALDGFLPPTDDHAEPFPLG